MDANLSRERDRLDAAENCGRDPLDWILFALLAAVTAFSIAGVWYLIGD